MKEEPNKMVHWWDSLTFLSTILRVKYKCLYLRVPSFTEQVSEDKSLSTPFMFPVITDLRTM